jgi:hypothetical protein
MDRLTALTHSSIRLPGTPLAMDEMEELLDDLLDLIDEALALMEDSPCG